MFLPVGAAASALMAVRATTVIQEWYCKWNSQEAATVCIDWGPDHNPLVTVCALIALLCYPILHFTFFRKLSFGHFVIFSVFLLCGTYVVLTYAPLLVMGN
jgi:hypothetical protein